MHGAAPIAVHGTPMLRPRAVARRRIVVVLAGLGWTAVAAPARGAPPASATIGLLSDRIPDGAELALIEGFRAALGEHGWVDGRNLTLLSRHAGADPQHLPDLAGELVASRVALIFATTLRAALAAKARTAQVPVVFTALADPVEQGLVASLARPGGNATGVAVNSSVLIPKRLQLLKEAMPSLKRVAVLFDPQQDEACLAAWDALRKPAQAMGITIERVPTPVATDYVQPFARMAREHFHAVLVPATTRYYNDARIIALQAAAHRMVLLPPLGDLDTENTLLAYGPLQIDAYRRAAIYADRILRGATPATLPVEQPTRYELVLNRRVARALGVEFPRALLARADRVID